MSETCKKCGQELSFGDEWHQGCDTIVSLVEALEAIIHYAEVYSPASTAGAVIHQKAIKNARNLLQKRQAPKTTP